MARRRGRRQSAANLGQGPAAAAKTAARGGCLAGRGPCRRWAVSPAWSLWSLVFLGVRGGYQITMAALAIIITGAMQAVQQRFDAWRGEWR